jgi:hypothetical protein
MKGNIKSRNMGSFIYFRHKELIRAKREIIYSAYFTLNLKIYHAKYEHSSRGCVICKGVFTLICSFPTVHSFQTFMASCSVPIKVYVRSNG